ncbi:MAG: hypothetical protein D6770_02285 [Anaerolineae bacterium]|nr:MAG: hypothetical protein D6770_02285 [Anaerolineae bacterium]
MPESTHRPALDIGEILSREFEYAAQTAFQANEDRVRVFNYYIATAGTLLATLAVADFANRSHRIAVAIAFTLLSVWGFLSLLELIKLRVAWRDSVRAMCQIKEYYLRANPDLEEAFRWRTATIPAAGKKWSIAFLKGLTLSLFNATSVGCAVFFWGWVANGEAPLVLSLVGAAVFFLFQIVLWDRVLR